MTVNAGADVMITGDIDHHEGIDAVAQGLTIIDAGHYGIEKIFISYMEDFMKRELPELVYTNRDKRAFCSDLKAYNNLKTDKKGALGNG